MPDVDGLNFDEVMLCRSVREKTRNSYAVRRDNGNAHYGLNVTRGR